MVDTLETAATYGMQQGSELSDDIDQLLAKWSQLSMMLNSFGVQLDKGQSLDPDLDRRG